MPAAPWLGQHFLVGDARGVGFVLVGQGDDAALGIAPFAREAAHADVCAVCVDAHARGALLARHGLDGVEQALITPLRAAAAETAQRWMVAYVAAPLVDWVSQAPSITS